jgi:hypothetical protein
MIMLWGPGTIPLGEAISVFFEGKDAADRQKVAEEIAAFVRARARGDRPAPKVDPLQKEEHAREGWARMVAAEAIAAVMLASERTPHPYPPPSPDQRAMLREIARLALWHMPNAADEARELVRQMTVERMKNPHPGDDQK